MAKEPKTSKQCLIVLCYASVDGEKDKIPGILGVLIIYW